MDDLEKRIIDFFDLLKVEKNLRGYAYLVAAVKKSYLDPNYKGKTYSCLFKELANDFETTVTAIGGNIRTVLDVTWTKNYSVYQYKLYDHILSNHHEIPTPNKFIERTVKILHSIADTE